MSYAIVGFGRIGQALAVDWPRLEKVETTLLTELARLVSSREGCLPAVQPEGKAPKIAVSMPITLIAGPLLAETRMFHLLSMIP